MYYDYVSKPSSATSVLLYLFGGLGFFLIGVLFSRLIIKFAVTRKGRSSNYTDSGKRVHDIVWVWEGVALVTLILFCIPAMLCSAVGLNKIVHSGNSYEAKLANSVASVYTVHSVSTLEDNKVDITKDRSNERDICIVDLKDSTNQFRLEKCHLFSDATKSVPVPGTRR